MKKTIQAVCLLLFGAFTPSAAQNFSYLNYINEKTVTLSASILEINTTTGVVKVNGVDTSQPQVPFTFTWGDGTSSQGWFPQEHLYTDVHKNYGIQVSSEKESVSFLALFTEPVLDRKELPEKILVDINNTARMLPCRWYAPRSSSPFTAQHFGVIREACIEYTASVMASITLGYCGDYLWYCPGQTFNQLIVNENEFQGGLSYWFTDPPSLGVNQDAFRGSVWWLVIAHEMAHNFTLDFPASHHTGGRIDGNANAIYSETLARIISFCMGYDLFNSYGDYGIPDDLASQVRDDFINGFRVLRNDYLNYLSSGKHFTSWNDPSTPPDETQLTFSALSYEFMVRAEQTSRPVAWHAKRLMEFFSHFNPDWERQYDRNNPSDMGNLFRSTLLVAAISFALQEDLRDEFRELNFPVSDEIYDQLIMEASSGIHSITSGHPLLVFPNPAESIITISGWPVSGKDARLSISDALGRLLMMKPVPLSTGNIKLDLSSLPEGIYNIIIQSDTETLHRKVIKTR